MARWKRLKYGITVRTYTAVRCRTCRPNRNLDHRCSMHADIPQPHSGALSPHSVAKPGMPLFTDCPAGIGGWVGIGTLGLQFAEGRLKWTDEQRHSVGYRCPGQTAIWLPPRSHEMPDFPLITPIFAVPPIAGGVVCLLHLLLCHWLMQRVFICYLRQNAFREAFY